MRNFSIIRFAAALLGAAIASASAASATTIRVTAVDTADGSSIQQQVDPRFYDFGGSPLSIDVTFDLADGPYSIFSRPEVTNVSGSAQWVDGSNLMIPLTSGRVAGQGSGVDGSNVLMEFNGPGVPVTFGSHTNVSVTGVNMRLSVPSLSDVASGILSSAEVQSIGFQLSSGSISILFDSFSESLTSESVSEVAPVPLPASVTMLLASVGLLGFMRLRKQGEPSRSDTLAKV